MQAGKRVLRVHIIPFVANEVVIPALHTFQEQYPDVELRIETSPTTQDPRIEELEMAVRLGRGEWPGYLCENLGGVTVSPVCSPELIKQDSLRSLKDLANHTLIKVSSNPDYWDLLTTDSHEVALSAARVLTFDNYYAAMSAAEKGLGLRSGFSLYHHPG